MEQLKSYSKERLEKDDCRQQKSGYVHCSIFIKRGEELSKIKICNLDNGLVLFSIS